MYVYLNQNCDSQLLTSQERNDLINWSYLNQFLTIIIIEFEPFANNLNSTISSICVHFKSIKIVIISEEKPYPPLLLTSSANCVIKLITLKPDLSKSFTELDPFNYITTNYVLIVSDFTKLTNDSSVINLKHSLLGEYQIIAIPVIDERKPYYYNCLMLDVNIREWTLTYSTRFDDHYECDMIRGDFVYLMKTKTLKKLSRPFLRPFADSFFIQAKLKGITVSVEDDLKFFKDTTISLSAHDEWKMDNLYQNRLKAFYLTFGIKKVVETHGNVEWFGCTKKSQRCFPSVVNDTPNYLLTGHWTPPCCLENLRITSRHVFAILEQHKVRYWLEGGSLLGAARNGDIIPWDYDVDIGIYQEDIKKCDLLIYSQKSSIKDDQNFVWEKAQEGDFFRVQFSETNRVHVDIFPFYSKNGIMTKKTWFPTHPQDKEFPESFLIPLSKIKFADWNASAPHNVTQFLEYKFGKGVIESPEYPNPALLSYSKHL